MSGRTPGYKANTIQRLARETQRYENRQLAQKTLPKKRFKDRKKSGR